MSELVQALKAEHANIHKMLVNVSNLGVNTEKGHTALVAAKTGLLSHLAREDEHLYPVLFDAAQDDPILADALDFFGENLVGVAEAALAFFDKYEEKIGADDEFEADFSNFVNVLTQRIQKEESVIYKMFDQLHDETG